MFTLSLSVRTSLHLLALLCGMVFLGLFSSVPVSAYSVSVSAPSSITFNSVTSSNVAQSIYANGGQFQVSDTRGSSVGYYATLSISNLSNGTTTLSRSNVALYVTGATVSTASGSANPSVVVPTGSGAIGTAYVSLANATTLVSRTNAWGGLYGIYAINPVFRVTVPAYSPVGAYTGVVTVTLIENDGACDPNYSWNGSSCVANTQSVACSGSVPSAAIANSATSYTQTWNGSAWAPTSSWSYSASAGTCTYACNSGYSWNGSSCIISAAASFFEWNTLALHMNGNAATSVVSAFADMGNNGKTVTATAGAVISTSQSKFGGAAGYFSSTSYLNLSNVWDFQFGTGDFTIDFWVNFSTLHGANNANNILISDGSPALRISLNENTILRVTLGGTATNIAWSPSVGTWYNVAITRENGTVRLFVNGTLVGSGTNTGNASPPTYLRVGNSAESIDGYLDELRITRGIARYTASFTAPSARFGDTASEDAYYANTILLMHMDGANASTFFADSGNNGKTVTAAGDAKISTAQSKFGGASAYFDGTGDKLTATSNDFLLGTESFTTEMWIYPTSGGGGTYPRIMDFAASTSGTESLYVGFVASTGKFVIYDGALRTPSASYSLNQWHHVALVRAGSTLKLFVDGSELYSGTTSVNINGPMFFVGAANDSSEWYIGYMDDVRITKWVARYAANFTPMTSEFVDE